MPSYSARARVAGAGRVLGGLDATTKKLLACEDLPLRITPPPGMRLAREWAGRTYQVVVIESGIVYEGKT